MRDIQYLQTNNNAKLQNLKKNPIRNYFKIRKLTKNIKAIQEGSIDILTPSITTSTLSTEDVKWNNYKTYHNQLDRIYDMYKATCNYGAELLGGIIELRTAFIGGEGISVFSNNKATKEFIKAFLEQNRLNGSKLIEMLTVGELEGKCLLNLFSDKKKINMDIISYYKNRYEIIDDKIEYLYNQELKQLDKDSAVFVKLGGIVGDNINTTNRIHRILTDIENFSRAKYDLRNNTHLFGKYMLYWKTATYLEAKQINNDIANNDFKIGMGYAGTADFKIVEPSGAASKAIIDDLLVNLKIISTASGIPIHWFAWTELMSNRATADSLIEVISASTKKERLIWEESIKEIIEKAMILAVDQGLYGNEIIDDFNVKLPLVSIALLQQIMDIWIPLWQENIISKATLMNLLPAIDPLDEQDQIDKEKKSNGENSILHNNTIDRTLEKIKNGENYE